VKVAELFEHEYKPLSEIEFEHLPAPNPKNINDRFKVGNVAYDNIHGMGAVPNNSEVNYFGFTIFITPAVFLRFAAAGDRGDVPTQIAQKIKAHYPIGTPFLNFDFNEKAFGQGEPLVMKIIGHEGRARMKAIEMVNGDLGKVPVHVLARGELRARHLNEKFFEALRDRGAVPEKGAGHISDLHIGKIFWMGKEL
jgi:hypothetical protein